MLNVRMYEFIKSSAEAFDAEYGLDGFNLYSSFAEPVLRLPKTSSVDMCTNLFFCVFKISRILNTPKIFESINGLGLLILLSTCDSAAKLIITSQSPINLVISFLFVILPLTKE